jgi:hypothetical protein
MHLQPHQRSVAPERWLEQMLAHPHLVAVPQIADHFQSYYSVALELRPLYSQLAASVPDGAHWRLCLPLLLDLDRDQEAPLLIDDIEQELHDHPTRFMERNTWPLDILRYRFGVNHFWDVAAWRQWWASYQRSRVAS